MDQTHAQNRPDPVRRFWYAFGGSLGSRHSEWVLHDVTSRTRRVRQVAHTVVKATAVGAMAILVFGFGWITWLSLIGGLLVALTYHAIFFDAFAEHRLFQQGYPWGTAQRIVNERDRRTIQIGYAAVRRSLAPIPVAGRLNGLAMMPND